MTKSKAAVATKTPVANVTALTPSNDQLPALNDEDWVGINPLIKLALHKDFDGESIKQAMQLQREYNADLAKQAFFDALAKFRSLLKPIKRDVHVYYELKDNKGWVDYWHCSLGYTMEVINPLLAECDLSVMWDLDDQDPTKPIRVDCELSHRLGHQEFSSLSALPDKTGGKNDIQAKKSTVSYLERITVFARLGLSEGAPMGDDDARATQETVKGSSEERQVHQFELKRKAFTEALESEDSLALYIVRATSSHEAWIRFHDVVQYNKSDTKQLVDDLLAEGERIRNATMEDIAAALEFNMKETILECFEEIPKQFHRYFVRQFEAVPRDILAEALELS